MENQPPPTQTNPKQAGCLGVFLYLLSLGWLISSALARNISNYFTSTNPGPASPGQEFSAALTHALLLMVPFILLTLRWSEPRFRNIYQAWLWASGGMLLFSPAFLIEVDEAQTIATAQIGLLLIFIAVLIIQRNFRIKQLRLESKPRIPSFKGSPSWAWYLAALTGMVTLAPWLWNGALGALLDSLLFTSLSALLSITAILLIEVFIWMPSLENKKFTLGEYLIQATGIGGVLQILSSAAVFPFGGMHILLMVSLPVLSWSLAALIFFTRRPHMQGQTETSLSTPPFSEHAIWVGPAWLLIFLGFCGPLLFIDADELAAVISMSSGEIFFVALRSAGFAFLLSLVAGIGLMSLLGWKLKRITKSPGSQFPTTLSRTLSWATILMVFFLLLIYWIIGQPGLFGERMLVILSKQEDVSQFHLIEDYQVRRNSVFEALTQHALQDQVEIRQLLDRLRIPYTSYYLLNAIKTVDNPFLRAYLLSRQDVDRILDGPRLRPLPRLAAESSNQFNQAPPEEIPWNLQMIHADKVWQETGITGKGMIIGQSDSGVQGEHPDLSTQYRGKNGSHDYNWFDPWYASTEPVDLGGHGTHTLGTALGKTTGVAPDAQWIACVNLARNLGNPALYLDCMQFMFAPFPQGGDPFTQGEPSLGAHVLNNSWGCPEFEGCDPLVFLPAVKALEAAGIFVVAGAGNEGPGCSTVSSPLSLYAEVFAVGAMDEQGNLASFSSLGPVTSDGSLRVKPDLLAPGVEVLSTLPGSTYGTFSGTSMASPHVAGVVALIWSANPDLIGDIETTRKILAETAQPYTGYLPECTGANQLPSTVYGFGILDAYAAVQMALEE